MKHVIELKPIRSEKEYEYALRAVSLYFDNEPELGTSEADQFEMLLILIEAYEAKHHAIMLPDPIEAIKFRMEQARLTPKDLEPIICRSNRVYTLHTRRSWPANGLAGALRFCKASLGSPQDLCTSYCASQIRCRAVGCAEVSTRLRFAPCTASRNPRSQIRHLQVRRV